MQKNIALLGKKCGMTLRFQEDGKVIPCTVLYIEKNVVVQKKSSEKEGYSALQLASGKISAPEKTVKNRIGKPLQEFFKKSKIEPRRHLFEVRVSSKEELGAYNIGQELGVEVFSKFSHLDVSALSKGKGFQGAMKRWGFRGGPASHGSRSHRRVGSIGMCSDPGRCFPGLKMPGRMGGKKVTVQSLSVYAVYPEKGVVLLKGAVPGPVGNLVKIAPAMKKMNRSNQPA